MEQKSIDQQRGLRVVKSNEMIRRGRFNLSLVEQRIVLYMISKIKPGSEAFDTITFTVKEFCEVCGIQYWQNMTGIKEAIKGLADKSMWIPTGYNRQQTLIRWIEKPYLDQDSGVVRMRLDRDLLPYLLNLKSNFTEYQLISTLALHSGHSLKLYELLRSYLFAGKYETNVEDLKEYLQVDKNYQETKYFNRDVLARAIEEINDYTDIEISCENIRHGRNITGYRFVIQEQEVDHVAMTRAYLSGKRPSKHKREQDFKKYMEQLQGQISLFDAEKEGGGE